MQVPPRMLPFVRAELRRRASQGNLMEKAFQAFKLKVFSSTGPATDEVLRAAFFAGANELLQLSMHAVDDGDDVSPAEEQFLDNVATEIATTINKLLSEANSGRSAK